MKKTRSPDDPGLFNIEPKKEKPEQPFKGLQRPIKITQPNPSPELKLPDEAVGEDQGSEQWLKGITDRAKNAQFNQVLEILKNDKELEPLLYDHRELLETLSGMKSLSSKQMLSIISAAEKEFYECSHNYRDKPKERKNVDEEEEQEFAKKLEEEVQLRKKAEDELAEIKAAKEDIAKEEPPEGVDALKMMNENLLEENKGLTKILNDQAKYMKEVDKLQQVVMSAKSEKHSMLKSKEKLEEDFEKNNKMIDDLKQEISLLQQERDNLTRKLASTVRSQLGSTVPAGRQGTKYTTPFKILEDSRASKPVSTGLREPLKRSRSFDSSLKYNRDLAALLMETKGPESKVEPVRVVELSEERLQDQEQKERYTQHPDGPTTYSSTHKPDNMTLSQISGYNRLRERPQLSRKEESRHDMSKIVSSMEENKAAEKELDQTLENEKLHNAVNELKQENQYLTSKLQEAERKCQQAVGSRHSGIFGSDISRIAPTFANTVSPGERLYDMQSTPLTKNYTSQKGDPRSKETQPNVNEIMSMLEDVGETLKIKLTSVADKDKEPLDNIKQYVKTLKRHLVDKEQTRELESAMLEGRQLRDKARKWKEEIDRLEDEVDQLREENKELRRQQHRAESDKIHAELSKSQQQYATKIREENIELMEKYDKVVNENYELKIKLRDLVRSEKSFKQSFAEPTPQANVLSGQFLDYKIKLDEQLLKEREKNAKLMEGISGLSERNEMLKEELSLHRDRNRQLEREMLRYVKKATNFSQEATVHKHNYKSIAANHALMSDKLRKLQHENKTLKERVNASQTPS